MGRELPAAQEHGTPQLQTRPLATGIMMTTVLTTLRPLPITLPALLEDIRKRVPAVDRPHTPQQHQDQSTTRKMDTLHTNLLRLPLDTRQHPVPTRMSQLRAQDNSTSQRLHHRPVMGRLVQVTALLEALRPRHLMRPLKHQEEARQNWGQRYVCM